MTDKDSTDSDSVVHIRRTNPCSDVHAPQFVIAEIIEAPLLRGITIPDLVEFKNKREIYERRLCGIDPDSHAVTHLKSYRDSIPRHLLKVLVFSGMVEATKVEEITEEDLKNCIAENTIVDFDKRGLEAIEEKLAGLDMEVPGNVGTLTESMKDLCSQYLATLEKWGYDNLIELAPDAAIGHIMKRINPYLLRTRMYRMMHVRSVDGMKKNFGRFFKDLLEEARRIDNCFG